MRKAFALASARLPTHSRKSNSNGFTFNTHECGQCMFSLCARLCPVFTLHTVHTMHASFCYHFDLLRSCMQLIVGKYVFSVHWGNNDTQPIQSTLNGIVCTLNRIEVSRSKWWRNESKNIDATPYSVNDANGVNIRLHGIIRCGDPICANCIVFINQLVIVRTGHTLHTIHSDAIRLPLTKRISWTFSTNCIPTDLH